MASQKNLKQFNEVYISTYNDVLRYVICKCSDINDVNDIIQDVYLDFWNILDNKSVEVSNVKKYLLGIANNKIKHYYTSLNKRKTISIFSKNDDGIELIDSIKSDIDIEQIILTKSDWKRIWNHLKTKKNKDIPKVFYLHYKLELTIKEIAKELDLNESYIKNLLYRTLNELYLIYDNKKGRCDM